APLHGASALERAVRRLHKKLGKKPLSPTKTLSTESARNDRAIKPDKATPNTVDDERATCTNTYDRNMPTSAAITSKARGLFGRRSATPVGSLGVACVSVTIAMRLTEYVQTVQGYTLQGRPWNSVSFLRPASHGGVTPAFRVRILPTANAVGAAIL